MFNKHKKPFMNYIETSKSETNRAVRKMRHKDVHLYVS